MSTTIEPSPVTATPSRSIGRGGNLRHRRLRRTCPRPVVRSGPVVAGFLAFAFVLDRWPEYLGDPTRIRQWAEYLCYAIVAVGIAIAWGRGGMLTLGQGVFFGLGAYAMGMYLSLEQVPDGAMPEFMSLYSDYKSLPWLWQPFKHLWFAAAAAVVFPMLVAAGLGWLVFNRRIRGAYFAHPHPGVRARLLAPARRPAPAHGGYERPDQLRDRLRPEQVRTGHQRVPLRHWRPRVCSSTLVIARQIVKSRYGALARRHTRRRGPRAVPRLRPGGHEDVRLRSLRRDGRARRRVERADHRHRGAEPVRGDPVDPDGRLGRDRWTHVDLRRGDRRPARELGQDQLQRESARRLAVPPGRRCSWSSWPSSPAASSAACTRSVTS